MATYLEIAGVFADEVAFLISPTVEGDKVRVELFRFTTPDILDTYTEKAAQDGETIVRFKGLPQGQKYWVRACINWTGEDSDDWSNDEVFTVKRSGVVDKEHHLITIPVLPRSFQQFSWDDWPDSRAALVSGGLVLNFEKECWNAIVTKVYDAIMDAGLFWQTENVEYTQLQILDEYGEFTAQKLNVLLDEIYCPIPLPFLWEDDASFRGYVGRRHFKGLSEVGDEADPVYAEYLLEVVRRLNLLIQIMRGWGPELEQIVSSNILTSTEVNRKIEWGLAAPFAKEEAVSVDYIEPPGRGGISGVLETDPQGMAAEYSAKMDKGKRRPFSGTEGTITRTKSVNIPQSKGVVATPSAASGKTDYTGDKFSSIKVSPLPQTVGQAASRVRSLRILSGIPRWVVFNADTIASDGTAAPDSGYAMLTYPRGFAGVSEAAEIAGAPEGRACGRGYSATRPATSFGLKKNVPVAVGEKSASKATAAISTAWLPPVWIDGGLWIRQSHSVTKNENGELVIT